MNSRPTQSWVAIPFVVGLTIVTLGQLKTVLGQIPTVKGEVEKLEGEFRFTEGPAWNGKDAWYFSDLPNNAIYRWNEVEGKTLIRKGKHNSNGIVVDRDGGLIFLKGDAESYGAHPLVKKKHWPMPARANRWECPTISELFA